MIGNKVDILTGSSFSHNPLSQITVAADNPKYRDMDGKGVYTKDGKELIFGTTSGIIASGTEKAKELAFSGRGLEHVIIPAS